MDEDLKIVLTSELEADEQASAQRISAQLPNIAKLINSKGSIKVGVSLDDTNIKTQTQRISSQLQSFSAKSKFSMKLDFGSDKVDDMVKKLRGLNVPDSAIKNFIDGIDKGIVGITQIRTGFSEVGDSAKTVTATVEGITAAGERLRQTISQGFKWDNESERWEEGVRRSTTDAIQNYEQLAKEEEKAAQAAKKATADNIADVVKLEHQLDSVRNCWAGINKTVKQDAHVSELQAEYERISDLLRSMDVSGERFGSDMTAVITTQISSLNELASAYAKLEKAPTELRAKDVTVIKQEQMNRLDTFEKKLSNSSVLTDELSRKIASLRTELGKVSDANGITAFMDKFGVLKSEADSLRATLAGVKMSQELEQSAQRIADTMDVTNLRVEELRQKYSQLSRPTEEVTKRVQQLAELQAEVVNAESDQKRIDAYERLNVAIDDCKDSLTILNRMQGGEVRDFALTQNLEKAKADLADVGRKWSAFKKDPGLNAQFRELRIAIQKVDDQMDLKKWTAQFSRFKAEIKAAGMNMMSLGDILKNNVSKVFEWVSATAVLFRALRLLKSAASTVVGLDTAMIDLRKTTDETDATYRKFYLSANETAKQLGVTTAEVIAQTAEWSRLGYSMAEAAKMAEDSVIFAAISPELNTEEATDGLISIMKAFGLEADEVLDGVISKINKLGKRIAQQCSNVLKESSYIG